MAGLLLLYNPLLSMVAKSCTMKHGKSWDYHGIFAQQTGAGFLGFLYLNFQNQLATIKESW